MLKGEEKRGKNNRKKIGFIKKKCYLVILVLYIFEKKFQVPPGEMTSVSLRLPGTVPSMGALHSPRAGASEGAKSTNVLPALGLSLYRRRPAGVGGGGRAGSEGSWAQHGPCQSEGCSLVWGLNAGVSGVLTSHGVQRRGSGAGVVLYEARARHKREGEEWGKEDETGSTSGEKPSVTIQRVIRVPGQWAGVWEGAPVRQGDADRADAHCPWGLG